MNRGKILVLALLFFILLGFFGWWYVANNSKPQSTNTFPEFTLDTTDILPSGSRSPTPAEQMTGYESLKSYKLEKVVTGLEVPWSLVFTSPTRWLVTQRPGRVSAILNGKVQEPPLLTLGDVSSESEEGLMGMVLDSDYVSTKYVYLSYAYRGSGGLAVKIMRYKDAGDQLIEPRLLLDGIPAAQNHAGTRLRFGPDGKLYITTGDASNKELAQDMNSLGGKILRMNKDGSVPSDNPSNGSYIYSAGHRNPQGIDFHPVTNQIVSSEHGPSVFDGPAGGDEVNLILPGKNYGWPLVSHEKNQEGFIPPLLVFTPAVAPASGVFYRGDLMPELKNSFLFGGLRGQGLFRVWFDPNDPWKTVRYDKFEEVAVGRVRDVAVGADGAVYFTTSNLDGRGQPREGDDAIYRLTPAE